MRNIVLVLSIKTIIIYILPLILDGFACDSKVRILIRIDGLV